MTTPDPRARRQRLLGLLLLGVALMLLATSATWFGSDDAGVGIASLVIGAVVAGAGVVLYRRSAAR
jgi:uncharacterized membrane-anchored protein